MALKKTNTPLTEDEEAIKRLIKFLYGTGLLREDDDNELTYAEQVAAQNKASVTKPELVDLSTLSITAKTRRVVDDTLNSLLTGALVLENAQELLTLITAVAESQSLPR